MGSRDGRRWTWAWRLASFAAAVTALCCQQDPPRPGAPNEPSPAAVPAGGAATLSSAVTPRAPVAAPPRPHAWLAACPVQAPPAWQPGTTNGPADERVLGCLRRMGPGVTDARIPLSQAYELTTFGGPGDEQPTHCPAAPDADNTWYYAANEQRFGCGTRARLVDGERRRCVVVEVADLGPHACVEEASRAPTWDVAPLVSMELFGARQAGWSEHRQVIGALVSPDTPLGPCDHLAAPAETRLSGGVGGTCETAADCGFAGAVCLGEADGFPGGYCSAPCDGGCQAAVGPHAWPVCAPLLAGADGDRCMASCDFTLFESGCRPGYTCALPPALQGQPALQGSVDGPPDTMAVCIPARCG